MKNYYNSHFLFFFALIVCALAAAKQAPDFQARTLDGKEFTLRKALKKDRSMLLCFWATWCGPCLQELKGISERLEREPNLNIDVVTVNIDTSETASEITPTIKFQKLNLPVVLDPLQNALTKYNDSKVIPFSVLISPTGEIRKAFRGYHETMFQEVIDLVSAKAK